MNPRNAGAVLTWLASLVLALQMHAQQPPPGPPPPRPYGGLPRGAGRGPGEGPPRNPGSDMQMPPGRWWNDAATAQSIGLTAEQLKKMDSIFSGARDHLIDLDAAVQKAEGDLQPLLEGDSLDRGKIMSQIDRLAQAKAELEKANAQMLLDLRLQLTHEQWMKLQAQRPGVRGGRPGAQERPPFTPELPVSFDVHEVLFHELTPGYFGRGQNA